MRISRMKVGDLVSYGSWYIGPERAGLIIKNEKTSIDGMMMEFFLVAWDDEIEWEEEEALEVISECR